MANLRKNILLFLPIAALMVLLLLRSQVAADAVRQGRSVPSVHYSTKCQLKLNCRRKHTPRRFSDTPVRC